MRVLIEILHPAHVHFFRPAIDELSLRGHSVLIASRDKDVALGLLDAYGLEHQVLSRQRPGSVALARELVTRVRQLSGLIREFRPTVLTGIMGPTISLAGRRHHVPSVVFYDTEIATVTNSWVYPLATVVCTPDCYTGPVRGSHVTYPGYHELAYLHPHRFEPDPSILHRFGVTPKERYCVIRFVSWEASHDLGEKSLTLDQKLRLVHALQERGRVLISSEGALPDELRDLRLEGPVEDVHHVLAFASVVAGESATMATEAAVLGTPSVFISRFDRGYVRDLERYGLSHVAQPTEFDKAIHLATRHAEFRDDRAAARQRLLADKVDVTSWVLNFLEERFQ